MRRKEIRKGRGGQVRHTAYYSANFRQYKKMGGEDDVLRLYMKLVFQILAEKTNNDLGSNTKCHMYIAPRKILSHWLLGTFSLEV